METVTPVSSHDAEKLQQEIMSEASRAFQMFLENLKQEWNQKINKKDNLKEQVKITIGGEEKDPLQLTWEDYGKLQALSQQDIGENNPNFADIEVIELDYDEETPLLATNHQGTLLTNTFKPLPPSEITASTAVSQALNKLANSPTKDYLLAVNQQLTQQLEQQHQFLKESQQINQQLTQQLHQSQSLTLESQKINQEQAKLLQNYQQLQQLRDKKDPHWWSKAGTHLKDKVIEVKNQAQTQLDNKSNKFVQFWTSLNQWWLNKNQQNEKTQLASNLRYFAQEMMGTFDKKAKLSGDKYDLEKDGNLYQLKSKQGSLLMKFQDNGLLGTQVIESNLTTQQQQDIKELAQFRNDPLFLLKNSHFSSNQPSSTTSNSPTQSSQKLQELQKAKDYNYILKGLKYLVDTVGVDLDKKNINGFDIQTENQGQTILITRFDDGDLVASQSQTGRQMIPTTSTYNDAQTLTQIVNKTLNQLQKQSSPFHSTLDPNRVQPIQFQTSQSTSSPQPTPLMVNEFSRTFLDPQWSETSHQYVTTGFDQEIGHQTQDVPDEITLVVEDHLLRINDNYPPDEVSLIARELDNYSVLAVANSAIDEQNRPLVNYRYFWLDNQKDNPNFDGIGTLLNWWQEKGQPSPQVQPNSKIIANLEENQKTNFYQVSQVQEKTQQPPLSSQELLKLEQDDSLFSDHYYTLHHLATRQSEPNENISWAWNITKLEEPNHFSVVKPSNRPIYLPDKSQPINFPTNPQDYYEQKETLTNNFQTIFEKLTELSTRMSQPINGIYRGYKIETKQNGQMQIHRKSNPFVKLAEYKNGETNITKKATHDDVQQLKGMVDQAISFLNHTTNHHKSKSR